MSSRRIDWENLPPSDWPPPAILGAMAAGVVIAAVLVTVLATASRMAGLS